MKILNKNYSILKLIEKIEKYGHLLEEKDFKQSEIFININQISQDQFKYGYDHYHHYLHTYCLRDYHSFDYNFLEAKADYIRLNFFDGSCVVRRQFLIQHFNKFSQRLSDPDCCNVREIMINNISIFHFRCALKYYYALNVSINLHNVTELYRLCEEFKIEGSFKKQVINYIIKYFSKITKTQGFFKNLYFFENGSLRILLQNKSENCSQEDYIDIHRMIAFSKWKLVGGFNTTILNPLLVNN
ncbi:BTB/POZ fold domain-containing protein [Strongyloides ratti]|uniref:BTB/POZ fold domain-containing protein n=1 Tax=Strongyloides ratti TaxID=34506 RepID=A0A090LDZ3_STRRB|nr:BTB/POZ fold domain-containing protein [Strongyloides ratti]CEF66363.1 BTB/POZ fold domain-containing protein [Strongyloides ratti]